MKAEHLAFTMRVTPDGNAHLTDKPTGDLTDMVMRAVGIDPYSSAKLKMLDDTREERFQLGMRNRREDLARSPELMQHNIDRLWAVTRDLAARKQGLFELWDDCAETGNDELVEAGAAARRYVLGIIHSRVQFTPDEVARLNNIRKSQENFSP